MTTLQQDLTFVEKAHEVAASSPILPGDPQADHLLQEARSHIYFWPKNFAGFKARIQIGQACWTLDAPNSRRFRLQSTPDQAQDPEMERWLKYHLGEMLSHREHPDVSKMASKTGVHLGDHDPVYGQKVEFAGDKMSSFYRIRDGKICQISRRYGGQHFLICIERHHQFQGRFAAANYLAYYWDGDQRLTKVESYHDDYTRVGRCWLPSLRRYTLVEGLQCLHREIVIDQFDLQ